MTPDVPRGTPQTSQTRHRVSDSPYDSWLTKEQAADAIGGSTKMVERLAAEGKIQQAHTQRQGRGAYRTVYQPDDVARIASERRPGPTAFVLPAGVTAPSNGNGHHGSTALQVAGPELTSSGEDLLRAFAVALRSMSETSETRETLFLTIAEAAAVSGLPAADLKRAIAAGELPARQTGRGGWRIRRRDLEAW
jgi:excisionase family DNA binding protein